MEGDKKRDSRLPERSRSLFSKMFKRSESNRPKSSARSSSSLAVSLEETREDKVDMPQSDDDTVNVPQSSDDTSKSAATTSHDVTPDVFGCPMWEDAISKILNSNEDSKLVAVVKELRTASVLSPNDTVSTIATMVKQDLEREVESQQGFIRESVEKTVSIINKFLAVGDVAASFDPVHAALPWAVVRFVLVVSSPFSLLYRAFVLTNQGAGFKQRAPEPATWRYCSHDLTGSAM